MIYPIPLDRANSHICDIRPTNLQLVSDSHKKRAHLEPTGSHDAEG